MNKHVLVFGSYVTDLCGRTHTFPRAGETVKGHYFKSGPGGKGSNQAVAAKRAGCDVTFVTKVGRDALGGQALEFYTAEGFARDGILLDDTEQTGAALIIVDEATAQNRIVVVSGACGNFTDTDLPDILGLVERSDMILLQLETNLEPVLAILHHAKRRGIPTVLNPAPATQLADEYFSCVDIITPNETEAHFFTGVEVTCRDSAQKAARKLLEKGVGKVVITMGKLGCYAHDGNSDRMIDCVDCGPVVDTTGAGDAFSGGMVAAMARGFDFFDAVRYGSVVAGLAVTRHGTAPAMPHREQIETAYQRLVKIPALPLERN